MGIPAPNPVGIGYGSGKKKISPDPHEGRDKDAQFPTRPDPNDTLVGGSPLDNNGNLKNFFEVFEVVLPWCVLYPRTAMPESLVRQSA